jgi:hypothetical protein
VAQHQEVHSSITSGQSHDQPSALASALPVAGQSSTPTASENTSSTVVGPFPTFSGFGEDQTQPFELGPGLVRFHLDHPSATSFGAFLLNKQGDHLALLANGAVISGTQVFGIKSIGSYNLHMIAEDDWSVRVEPLLAEHLQRQTNVSRDFEGKALGVAGPLRLTSGTHEVTWTHTGSFPASLVMWSADGQTHLEIAVNSSERSATMVVNVPRDDVYLLNVQADGGWSVTIR